ncbi:NUDIX domain-containing protein [Thalassotalea atypica]|uniref:NUDIX domain-containing protein n=1 Tax=Thalassotalea atypica TaxID=2054316 RepID=UPI002573DCCD|nr:NUDIX domain-containing protein [Thalassotalea atypica]
MKIKSLIAGFTRNNVNIHKVLTKYDGFFKINEYQLSHALFQGGESHLLSREIFERGDAVVLMPYDPKRDSLVFNEQFRPGALRTTENPWLLEFVAGMFGENESPQDVAIREAKEEANLDIYINDIEPIMEYLSSPGGTSEKIHLYVAKVDARNVSGVFGLKTEGEDIRVSEIKRADALMLLAEGKICNAATIIGLQWLALNSEALRAKWQDNDN